jgi:LPXTG-motif cell wall-anchored protein
MMKKVLAVAMAAALVVAGTQTKSVKAAEAEDFGDLTAFIAFGGDAAASGDWGYQYYGDGASSNAGDVTAVTASCKNGDTVTVSLTFPSASLYAWFYAPCVVLGDGHTTAELGAGSCIQDLTYSVDGVDCTDQIDFTVHPADGDLSWDSMWGEDTGSFTKDSCIRAVGGYNEWNNKAGLSASPVNFTTIEYTFTINFTTGDDVVDLSALSDDAAADDTTDTATDDTADTTTDTLPKTGTAPVALYVALGSVLVLGGAAVATKKKNA